MHKLQDSCLLQGSEKHLTGEEHYKIIFKDNIISFKLGFGGVPSWASGKEFAFQWRGCRFDPWSRNYDSTCHEATKPPCTTTTNSHSTRRTQHSQKKRKRKDLKKKSLGAGTGVSLYHFSLKCIPKLMYHKIEKD